MNFSDECETLIYGTSTVKSSNSVHYGSENFAFDISQRRNSQKIVLNDSKINHAKLKLEKYNFFNNEINIGIDGLQGFDEESEAQDKQRKRRRKLKFSDKDKNDLFIKKVE